MFTIDKIIKEFNNLPTVKKVAILWEALDCMQSYSGRTRYKCVALAMGYTENWDDELNEEVYTK